MHVLNYSMLGFSSVGISFLDVEEGGTPTMAEISVGNSHILFKISLVPCLCGVVRSASAEFREAVKSRGGPDSLTSHGICLA